MLWQLQCKQNIDGIKKAGNANTADVIAYWEFLQRETLRR